MGEVKIIEWQDEYQDDFVSLSVEWLEKYLSVEPADKIMLSDPHAAILDDGGAIFFARCRGRMVGTVAMVRTGPESFELAKLAVTEEFKRQGIGNRLIERCLRFARENGARTVVLYTNHKLKPAVGLYKKYGFREMALVHNKYLESDMVMELTL